MKSKILFGILVIALAAALVAGATGAWFTGEANLPTAEFEAGTVIVNADGAPVIHEMEGRNFDNVNPGDCATVCWTIVNEGSKAAELRVKVEDGWTDLAELDRVVYFAPAKDSEWVMYEEDGDMYLYYTGGPVAGTYGGAEATAVPLCLVLDFDGPTMGNEYKGEEYTIGGQVEAVQASNGAPGVVWGAAWTEATAEGYTPSENVQDYIDRVAETVCYNGGGGEDPPAEVGSFKVKTINFAPLNQNGVKSMTFNYVTIINLKDVDGDILDGDFPVKFTLPVDGVDYSNTITCNFVNGECDPFNIKIDETNIYKNYTISVGNCAQSYTR